MTNRSPGRESRPAHAKILLRFLSLLTAATFLAFPSCATIAAKSSSPIHVASDVNGARVRILDYAGAPVYEGVTPCSVIVEHGRAFFQGAEYLVEVTYEGVKHAVTVGTSINEWYLGNALLPGGLIGSLLIDPWTGAMFELETHDVDIPVFPRP